MTYLILDAGALLLILGFFLVTHYEVKRGMRFFEDMRKKLDNHAARVSFIASHVDWNSYARQEIIKISHRVGHDAAHLSLQAVRSLERLLTQIVRRLRAHGTPEVVRREPQRQFVKTLSDFKGHLEATRPEMPEIF